MNNCCSTPREASETSNRKYRPLVDTLETNQGYTIVADMPGATAENIHVDFEDGTLRLRAPVSSRASEGERVLLAEYDVGDYEMVFELPEFVDVDRIDARYENGVLTVTVPKQPEVSPRKVEIKVH